MTETQEYLIELARIRAAKRVERQKYLDSLKTQPARIEAGGTYEGSNVKSSSG